MTHDLIERAEKALDAEKIGPIEFAVHCRTLVPELVAALKEAETKIFARNGEVRDAWAERDRLAAENAIIAGQRDIALERFKVLQAENEKLWAVAIWAQDAVRFMHDGCACPGCVTRWSRGDALVAALPERKP